MTPAGVARRIVGFAQDDEGHWFLTLDCGHTQHVRHDPPWQVRAWVLRPEARAAKVGTGWDCAVCAATAPASEGAAPSRT